MADYWTTPKTDWDDNDGIGYEDLNRIEQNISAHSDANFRKVQGFGHTIDNTVVGQDGVLTVTPGSCYSPNGFPIRMNTNHVKNLTTWAQGNGATFGGMASAVTVAAQTWYYIFVIMNPVNGDTEIMFDDNAAGTNVSSLVYTEKRRVGSFKTQNAGGDGSFDLWETYGVGDYVHLNTVQLGTIVRTVVNNTSPNDDSFVLTTLNFGAGVQLPAIAVTATMNIISFDVNYGLFSNYGNFTVPANVMNGSDPQGEFALRRLGTGNYQTADADIFINGNNQLYVGMEEGGTINGTMDIRVHKFLDERLS